MIRTVVQRVVLALAPEAHSDDSLLVRWVERCETSGVEIEHYEETARPGYRCREEAW
jgi:hypothetical protein